MADKKKKARQKDARAKEGKGKKARESAASQDSIASAPVDVRASSQSASPSALAPAVHTGATPPSSTDTAILDAVIACLAAHGSGGLTTRRIAALAKVNEVTIFRRFGNKEGVLAAALAREDRLLQGAVVVHTGDLAHDLAGICNACALVVAGRPGALALLLAGGSQGDRSRPGSAPGKTDGPLAVTFAAYANLLAHYMHTGALRNEPPAHALAGLIGPILFAALPAAFDGSAPLPEADALVSAFLYGRAIDRPLA